MHDFAFDATCGANASTPTVVPLALMPYVSDPVAALVRRHDPDRFLTALFAPPRHRGALLTLYAFDHELARTLAVTSEPQLALIRLQWWREVVEGARRRHEVATPLAALLDAGRLDPRALLPIIDAYEIEAEGIIETVTDWRDWLLAGVGGIAVAAGRVLGSSEPERLRPAGAAFGVARVIRWNRVMARENRCLLPVDLLADRGISRHEAIASPESAAVISVLRRLTVEGQGLLRQAPSGRMSRAHVAAALPAVLARRDLRRGSELRPVPRGLADRLAVAWSGLTGRI